ncbi:atrophin-1-like, partial [Sabethes cyaneus]|uniref:atrophin-1-like n=1 Tax=Sabethes cyaneus TaxID=53552 RepID=UPI00237E7D97
QHPYEPSLQGILLASSSLQTDSPTPPTSNQSNQLLPASSSSGGSHQQQQQHQQQHQHQHRLNRRQSSQEDSQAGGTGSAGGYQRAPYAESESISSKHTSVLVSYWTCLTERMSSLICKCCERTLPPPAESV